MDIKEQVICFLPRGWEGYARRPHLEELANYFNITLIDPPITLADIIRSPKRIFQIIKRGSTIQLGPNMINHMPYVVLPYYFCLFSKNNLSASGNLINNKYY